VGLRYWPLPVAFVALVLISGLQYLVVRVNFREPIVLEEKHERLVNQVQAQIEGVRRTAMYDSTLGLYQRWYLETRLKQECARCRRYGLSLAVVVVKFNRTDMSDFPLDAWQTEATQAAYVTSRTVRNVDLAAIVADMEFAVSLVHCDREGGEVAMNRLALALKSHDCEMGMAVFPDDDLEPSELIELARHRVKPRPVAPQPSFPPSAPMPVPISQENPSPPQNRVGLKPSQ
jgi:GGDEF domain-containing protein